VANVSRVLRGASFISNEELYLKGDFADSMFILRKGVVAFGGMIRTQGRFFGEDMILTNGRRTFTVRALTFVDTMILDREMLFKLLENSRKFGLIKKKIRIATLRLALQRWFRRIGSLLVKVKTGFQKPLTKDQITVLKRQWLQKSQLIKASGVRPGYKLNKRVYLNKLDYLRLVCPKGFTLFPAPPKPTAVEITLKEVSDLGDEFKHLKDCLINIAAKLKVTLPKRRPRHPSSVPGHVKKSRFNDPELDQQPSAAASIATVDLVGSNFLTLGHPHARPTAESRDLSRGTTCELISAVDNSSPCINAKEYNDPVEDLSLTSVQALRLQSMNSQEWSNGHRKS